MEHINETEWNTYLAGSCEPGRAAWIDEHVKQCPQCSERMQSVHRVQDALAQWQVDTEGHDIAAKVAQAVQKQSFDTKQLWHRRIVSYAVRVAATVLIGVALGHWAGQKSAGQYIAKQEGAVVELKPSYLAAIDLQFASGLTWSVLSENSSDTEGQQ